MFTQISKNHPRTIGPPKDLAIGPKTNYSGADQKTSGGSKLVGLN